MSDDNAQASSNGDASAPDLGTKGNRLIAIHNYKPQDEGDLKLKKGQLVIAMANQEDEGWYFGFDPETGAEGEFPANYVADEGSDKANALLLSLKQKAEKAAAEAAKAAEEDAAEGAKKVDQEMSDLPLDDEDEKSGADVEDESQGPTGKTSSEAAATAAAERTAPYIDSVFLNLKYAIILRGVMALLALFGFACVAGGGYHNLTSKSRQVFTATTTTVMNQTVTVTDSAVDLSGVFYNIISAVQFLLAMGILIWLYETLVCIVFALWYMERIEEYSWLAKALLGVDSFFFFMLVVAGFNMGSAAMFDAQAIEVLLNAEINQSNMRAGVALMIIFVHLMVLSLVQDHTWLVLDLPGARSHRSMRQGNNQPPRTIKEAREERGIDNDEAAAQETAAVVDEVPEGDAVEVEAAEAVEVTVVDPEGDGI